MTEPFTFDESQYDKKVKLADYEMIEVATKDLKPFQGRLKTLSAENYQRLKKRMLKNSFRYPPIIWIDNGDHYLLDGHQRLACLRKMKKEGYEIPPIMRVIHVPANSYDEAREMVLELVSQFGHVSEEGYLDFTSGLDYDPSDFDMPSFVDDLAPEITGASTEVELDDAK